MEVLLWCFTLSLSLFLLYCLVFRFVLNEYYFFQASSSGVETIVVDSTPPPSRGKKRVATVDHESYIAKEVKVVPKAKSEKYREKRNKNNIASKRSREIRKTKFVKMKEQGDELEFANVQLRGKVSELEKEIAKIKSLLVKQLTSRKA